MEDDKEKMKELSEMLENPQDMEEDEPEPENEPELDLIQNEVPDTQVPNKHQQDEPMET